LKDHQQPSHQFHLLKKALLILETAMLLAALMTACGQKNAADNAKSDPKGTQENAAEGILADNLGLASLPAPSMDETSTFGVDRNINISTIDNWLLREDVAYRDVRMLFDPAAYADIGGDADLSRTLEGFKVIPYPYLATLQSLPVANAYSGDCLFEVVWSEEGYVVSAIPNYRESMMVMEDLFPKDKAIFLMCGGGGYAGMTKELLLYLGWSPELLYNVGGQWEYTGDRTVELKLYAEDQDGVPVYATWRADYAYLEFDKMIPATQEMVDAFLEDLERNKTEANPGESGDGTNPGKSGDGTSSVESRTAEANPGETESSEANPSGTKSSEANPGEFGPASDGVDPLTEGFPTFTFTHYASGGTAETYRAVVLFEQSNSTFTSYQVAFSSCTCRDAIVNYYSVCYVEILNSKRNENEAAIRAITFLNNQGLWGDSNPNYYIAEYTQEYMDEHFVSQLVGATKGEFDAFSGYGSQLDRIDVDAVTGATVSTSNITSMLKSLFEYHADKYYR